MFFFLLTWIFILCGICCVFCLSHLTLLSTMGFEGTSVSQDLLPTQNQPDVQHFLDAYGLEYTPDGQWICWWVSNKKHPRNWPAARKIYDTGLIIFLDLFAYGSGGRVYKDSLQSTLFLQDHSTDKQSIHRTCVSTAGVSLGDCDSFGISFNKDDRARRRTMLVMNSDSTRPWPSFSLSHCQHPSHLQRSPY